MASISSNSCLKGLSINFSEANISVFVFILFLLTLKKNLLTNSPILNIQYFSLPFTSPPFCKPLEQPSHLIQVLSSYIHIHNYSSLKVVFSLSPRNFTILLTSSVQFSHSVMSDSSKPHGLQHTRLFSPSSTHGVCSNSCPWS